MMNLTKTYSALLDLNGLSENECKVSLRRIFDRDIQENPKLQFLKKIVRPIKKEGLPSMDTLFGHLTTRRIEVEENNQTFKKSVFDGQRSVRLHWVKRHLDQGEHEEVEIFSTSERDQRKRKDVIRTYIYNPGKQYVIVLEPQNSAIDYYLLSAYYLYEKWGPKEMEKKIKNKLDEVF